MCGLLVDLVSWVFDIVLLGVIVNIIVMWMLLFCLFSCVWFIWCVIVDCMCDC